MLRIINTELIQCFLPMNRAFILLLFLTLSAIGSLPVFAQEWEWLHQAGGFRSDKGTTIVTDADGNIYFTGYYNEEGTFGPFNTGYSYQHSKETFVCKMDPDGNFLWVTNATNYYDDRGLGLCVDPQGNVYVTGTCWGGLNWPPLNVYNTSSYTDQVYVTKIDPNGNVVWMKNAGVNETDVNWTTLNGSGQTLYNDDHGLDIECDSQGNIYVTGFNSNVSDTEIRYAWFDNISYPIQPMDSVAFLAKLSNDGTWQWVKTFDGLDGFNQQRDNGLAVDDEDNVYVVGGFSGTAQFGTDVLQSENGTSDIYVVKYDSDGNYQYVNQVGDSLGARADQICWGQDGNMYLTGEFRSKVLFGTDDLNNYGSAGDKDIFVAKMSKDGQWGWATKAGSKQGGDRGIGICANDQGNIFVCGQFRGDAKFSDIEISAGPDSTQFFVGMINNAGIWQWVLQGGGPLKDRANSVAVDTACNLYVTGYFKNSMLADTLSLTSYSNIDMFIAKISNACEGQGPSAPPEEPTEEEVFTFQPTNVFTPNGDGKNDLLYFCQNCNVESHVVILNRWGNVVFEANDINTPWNGNNKSGEPVVDGTYFYHIDIEFENGEKERKSGFISLVR